MIEVKATLKCPHCEATNVVKNGKKSYARKQNYLCKTCKRQFVGDHALDYKGCHSKVNRRIKKLFCRGMGVRDIAEIEEISLKKVLSTLVSFCTILRFKLSHYDCLEIDEFWSYVGKKSEKVCLLYAYHRESGEIVS